MTNISHNLEQMQQQLAEHAARCGREACDITLLAVSKTKPVAAIEEAYHAGQHHFGENYAQEMAQKAEQLAQLDITWHFLGPIQSNKTRQIAEYAAWVHSIDRLKIAQRLNDQRPSHLPPLKVCIQVNIDNAPTKAGVQVCELDELLTAIRALPKLELMGLMAIPEPEHAPKAFTDLATLANDHQLPTLSMGMSGDWPQAVAAGSTIIRIGTAIFGERDYHSHPTA